MSIRRTTKLTSRPISPDAYYVAIELEKVDASTDRLACHAYHDLRITDHRGGHCVDIDEGDDYELVRSESLGNNLFYVVTKTRCYCPATTEYCKHRSRPVIEEQIGDAQVIEEPKSTPVAEHTSKGTSTGTITVEETKPAQITAISMRRGDDARGTLHNSARGSFLDQCFGTSKDGAKYRQAYIDSKRASL